MSDPWWMRDISPEERTRRERIVVAHRTGESCAHCGRSLEPTEPVWRCTFYMSLKTFYGGEHIRPFRRAVVCGNCWGRRPKRAYEWSDRRRSIDSFDLTTGIASRHEDRLGTRHHLCDGCGRPVAPSLMKPGQRYFVCSERCLREARRPPPPEHTCLVCEVTFTPTRKDANYCSPACRQSAYRHRKDER